MLTHIPFFFLQPSTKDVCHIHALDGEPSSCIVERSLALMVAADELAANVQVLPVEGTDGEFVAIDTLDYVEVHLGAAMNRRISLLDVLDSRDQLLWDAAEDLLNLRRCHDEHLELKAKVAKATGSEPWVVGDWLYFYSESFADNTLGLAAMETLLEHSTSGMAIIGLAGLCSTATPEERRVGRARAKNLARIGFIRIPGTVHLVADLTFNRPSVLHST